MSQADEKPTPKRWHIASELPPEVFSIWRKPDRAISPVAIVATVDADGTPRMAPYGSVRAVTPRILRFSPAHYQTTYVNLRREARVAVMLISPPNCAVSIRGRARVVRERMHCADDRAILEIDINEVKNDMVPSVTIESGVTIYARPDYQDWFHMVVGELEDN